MTIKWQEDMATGDENVDSHHKDLLRKVNDLLEATKQKRGGEELARLFWFLKRYVRRHFRDEEKLMSEVHFHGLPAHRLQHQVFFHDVQILERRFIKEGPTTIMIVHATQMMCNWIRTHFHTMDLEAVRFVQATRLKEQAKN